MSPSVELALALRAAHAGAGDPRILDLFSRVLAEPQPDWLPNVSMIGHPIYDAGHGASPPLLFQFRDDQQVRAGRGRSDRELGP